MRSMEARKARSSGRAGLMSALGHEQTSRNVRVMSVIPLKTDIRQREWHVRYVPKADISSIERLSADDGANYDRKPLTKVSTNAAAIEPSLSSFGLTHMNG
jgi:hypothetical protein